MLTHTRRTLLHLLLPFLLLSTLACAEQPRTVFRQSSQFNDVIIVRDTEDGLRQLLFAEDGAIQSAMNLSAPNDLVLPYSRAAMSGLAIVPHPNRILIIGLGGASMPKFLRQCYPDATIDCVEIDPVVADVAKRFFAFKEDANMKAHVADGRQFIQTTPTRYDLIFLDAYGIDSIPYSLATREFLQLVRDRLTDTGLVVANIWSQNHNPLYYSMLRTYRDVYPELHVIAASPTSGNRIVLASPRKLGLTRDDLIRRSQSLTAAPLASLLLPTLISDGYLSDATDLPADAKVLLDADAPQAQPATTP